MHLEGMSHGLLSVKSNFFGAIRLVCPSPTYPSFSVVSLHSIGFRR